MSFKLQLYLFSIYFYTIFFPSFHFPCSNFCSCSMQGNLWLNVLWHSICSVHYKYFHYANLKIKCVAFYSQQMHAVHYVSINMCNLCTSKIPGWKIFLVQFPWILLLLLLFFILICVCVLCIYISMLLLLLIIISLHSLHSSGSLSWKIVLLLCCR